MTWRDKLQPASFRGVAFEVDSSDFAGGRRGELHEYPLRDTPYFEDMGRKGRKFSFEGFIVGKDYMAGRDALISALEKGGKGQLIHPFYGSRNVAAQPFRVRESSAEGGVARFSLEFVESGEDIEPVTTDDKTAQVKLAADNFDATAIAAFAASFIASGFPEFVITSALTMVDGAANTMLGYVTDSELFDRVAAFASDASLLISTPAAFAESFVGLMADFPVGATTSSAALDSFTAYDPTTYLDDVPRTTASRTQESANAAAMASLIRRSAISAKSRVLADQTFVSVDDANSAMVSFADLADSEAEQPIISDDEYLGLRALNSKVVTDLSSRLGGLPRSRSITLPTVTPAIVLAYSLYEDVSRDTEIIDRNAIVRPGFISAAEPVKVLSE